MLTAERQLLAKLEEKEKKLEMLGKDTEEGKAFMVRMLPAPAHI